MSQGIPGPLKALLAAALVLFVGAALLQRNSPAGRSDPIASVLNGGPRGLLLLDVALSRLGRQPLRVDGDAALHEAVAGVAGVNVDSTDSLVILVPPPEETAFTKAEADALLDVVRQGARLVIACDPNRDRLKRLRPLLAGLGVACVGDTDDDTGPPLPARLAMAAPPGLELYVRDRGRVNVAEDAVGVLPLTTSEGAVGAVVVSLGRGDVVVFGSVSSLANDGLAEADNLAVLRFLLGARSRVVVDERHHLTRGAAAVARAVVQGPGPITALLCALLLVPLTMLALSPRRGELLADDAMEVPAAEARVRGLASLLAAVGPPPTSPQTDPRHPLQLTSTHTTDTTNTTDGASP